MSHLRPKNFELELVIDTKSTVAILPIKTTSKFKNYWCRIFEANAEKYSQMNSFN
jgi:hypothetical protein